MQNLFRLYTGSLAICLIWYYSVTPYLSGTSPQLVGLLLICLLVPSYMWLAKQSRDAGRSKTCWKDKWPFTAIVSMFTILSCYKILEMPTWSEEIWWIELAQLIRSGEAINFIGFKGDNPANLQAWPVAFFLLVTNDPILAARLPGVIYNLLVVYLSAETAAILSGKRRSLLAYLLPATSLWLIHFSRIGYNDNSSVAFLIAIQIYLLCRVILLKEEKTLAWFIFWTAVSFSTLYTPFVYSLVSIFLFVLLSMKLRKNRTLLLNSMIVLIASIAPTVGKVIQFPEQALGRHLRFLVRGNEWSVAEPGADLTLGRYLETVNGIANHILPPSLTSHLKFEELFAANLEPITFGFLLLGLLASPWLIRNNQARVIFFASGVALSVGLLLSNPGASIWRELCLAPFLFILAGLGTYCIPALALRCKLPLALITTFTTIIAAAQLYWFGSRYLIYLNQDLWANRPENEVKLAADILRNETGTKKYLVVTHEGLPARYMRAYVGSDTQVMSWREFEAQRSLTSAPAVIFVKLGSLPEAETERYVNQYCQSWLCSEHPIKANARYAGSVRLIRSETKERAQP